jgi:7-cyano-7-deazaguanine synthase in queuosine biosynthesis
LKDRLDGRQMDWLEIHSALFAADRAAPRDPGLDWNRSIELHIPVRYPDYWGNFTAAFEDIFASLTYDRLALHFHAGQNFADPPRQRQHPFAQSDCIALLSGGMDSFVGALELITPDKKPLFLAASGSGATNGAQSDVFKVIEGLDSSRELLKLIARRVNSNFPGDEQSQRSRSFLFVSTAALVAVASGFEDVYVNENGIMAVHVPLTAARHGSFSTRTATPRVLDQMGRLATDALGARVTVKNLLLGMTKGDVAKRASDHGHASAVKRTISCWAISHTRTHCGHCAPCILRRIACLQHSIDDVDYELDVLNDLAALDKDDAKDTLVHFIQLAEEFRDADDFDLEFDHADLINGASGLGVAETIALYRRWADEVLTTFARFPVPRTLMS